MAAVRTRFRLPSMLVACVAIALAGCHVSPSTDAHAGISPRPPATILIIRHAEKLPDGGPDLSDAGYARAQLLVKAFVPPGARPDLPTPQFIFAASPSKNSDRSALTVTPLAQALHLSINQDFKDHKYDDLAAELLGGRYAGKVVLVSWHHGKIPELATALGATPAYNPWPEQQFDRIWKIDYANGKTTLQDLPYEIAPATSK